MLLFGVWVGLSGCGQTVPGLVGSELLGAEDEEASANSDTARSGTEPANASAETCAPGSKGDCKGRGTVETCEPPKPSGPDEACWEQVKICYEKELDAKTCESLEYKCKQLPPSPAPNDACVDNVKICYEKGLDKETCEQIRVDCEKPGIPAPSPEEICWEQVKTCYAKGLDDKTCEQIGTSCSKPVEPGCRDQVEQCYAKGGDKEGCEALAPNCDPPKPQPDSGVRWCEEQLALCDKGVTDPETCEQFRLKCKLVTNGPD
jgi:hypothetical protein